MSIKFEWWFLDQRLSRGSSFLSFCVTSCLDS